MELDKYRKIHKLSYKALSIKIGLTENKTYRICHDSSCISLLNAHAIELATDGAVTKIDLLPAEAL